VLAVGATPSTLKVNGAAITIDATKLSIRSVIVNLNTPYYLTNSAIPLNLLPGGEAVYDFGGGAYVTFHVDDSGNVSFPSAENGVLAVGATPSTLKVNGAAITIDATKLSISHVDVNANTTAYPTNAAFSVRLLPGREALIDYSDYSTFVTFNVDDNGIVTFPKTETGVVSVPKTNPHELIVNGRKVSFNATALAVDMPSLLLDGELTFSTASVYSPTLLPGTEVVSNPGNSNSKIIFTLLDNGTFTYNSVLGEAGVLGGKGTKTLVISGEKIQVDATALAQQGTTSFTIAGVGTFSTATVQTIVLLPGWQSVSTSGGLQFNFLAEVADPLTGQFDVVNYDPSLDNILGGHDTNTLVIT
jgi:hypothetical protein